jgi:stress-induced morphogen
MDATATIKTILQEKIGATIVEIEDRSDLHKHHQGRMNAPVGSGLCSSIRSDANHDSCSIAQNLYTTTMAKHRFYFLNLKLT